MSSFANLSKEEIQAQITALQEQQLTLDLAEEEKRAKAERKRRRAEVRKRNEEKHLRKAEREAARAAMAVATTGKSSVATEASDDEVVDTFEDDRSVIWYTQFFPLQLILTISSRPLPDCMVMNLEMQPELTKAAVAQAVILLKGKAAMGTVYRVPCSRCHSSRPCLVPAGKKDDKKETCVSCNAKKIKCTGEQSDLIEVVNFPKVAARDRQPRKRARVSSGGDTDANLFDQEINGRVAQLEESIDRLRGEIDEMKEDNEEWNRWTKETDSEVAALETAVTLVHDRLAETQAELTETRAELAETKAELAEVRAEFAELKELVNTMCHGVGSSQPATEGTERTEGTEDSRQVDMDVDGGEGNKGQ
ncbi:hypothetical protein DL96DRAFT_1709973 [Flagelloscypha sp. PMI_526]|nr:hypothetical protein DL96DRAFT_1709973 [Flagelloscypha sp. PMI_526]